MFRNYLITALRNITRHKLYSFINIAGLAVGLACIIFVVMFIRDELSYDKWLPGTENLYRIEKTSYLQGRDPFDMATLPFPVPIAMRDDIPDVTAATRLYYTPMTLFAGDRQLRERVASVDPNFFQVVKLQLLQGDPAGVFHDPESVVLSQSAARKYFGTSDAIGKFVRTTANCDVADSQCLARLVPLKVTGIMRDVPHNSHLDGDVFMANTSIADRMGPRMQRTWDANSAFAYVRLVSGARPDAVIAKMAPLLDRAYPPQPGDPRKGSQRFKFHLTPLTDVHLTSGRWKGNEKPSGSRVTLYGVGIIGLMILFAACFNFMNLATAQASMRAREIALRKTHGARRGQVVVQFLGEAVLTALLSLVVALALVEILQPAFERLLQHRVAIHYDAAWVSSLVLIAVTAGLVSGIYPALVLSDVRPSMILRNSGAGRAGSARLQAALVVLQFAVSIGLGIAVIVVFSQINFARNLDLGFRKDNLLVVAGNGLINLEGRESFVQRLRTNPAILDVATADAVPFGAYGLGLLSAQVPGRSGEVALNQLVIGAHTAQILGMRLIAGRLLSDQRARDTFDTHGGSPHGANEGRNILVDATAASNLGFTPQQAIGKAIALGKSHVRIAGVIADAKFDGAREPARSTMYVYDPGKFASVIVRIRPDAIPQALSFIDRAWHDFAPTKAINRTFIDDNFGKLYQADERQGDLFGVFVAVAIFISCLGLFGLAALAASRRTKEIGIRKVFGARIPDLVGLLLWQFSIPVLIANAIAWPVAWYWLQGWLQGFAYRITLSPAYFVAAGAAALVIAWVTVFGHALHVARAHPIHALRTE